MRSKLHKLINKFADKIETDKAYSAQREMLYDFSSDFSDKMQNAYQELVGDFLELKESHIKYPKELQKVLKDIIGNTLYIQSAITASDPYAAGKMLLDYLSNRISKSFIDNFDFIATEIVKNNKWDLDRFRGIKTLREAGNFVENFINEHPLMIPPGKIDILMPRERSSDFPLKDFKPTPSNANDPTFVGYKRTSD